jgi:hypothetical protein
MTPAEHQARAERITRSLGKCHVADYEIVIEGAMLASAHWFNLGLHRLGWSAPTHDVVHAEFITKGERLKLSLLVPDLLAARDAIEAARALFVRGSAPGGEDAARQVLACLVRLRDAALGAQPMLPDRGRAGPTSAKASP